MSSVTEANARAQLRAAVAWAERFHNLASTDTNNLIGFLDIAAQLERGDFSSNRAAAQTLVRRRIASTYADTRAWLGAALVEYASLPVVGRPISGDNAAQRAITVLYDYFIRFGIRVISRGFTFGTPAAVGTPAGNGFIRRLNVDRFGVDLEAQTVDIKQAEVLIDQSNGGTRFAEVFEFRGTSAAIDLVEDLGVGGSVSIAPPRVTETQALVRNPHFDQVSGTPAQPVSWTVTGTVTPDTNTARQFAETPGIATPRSLQLAAGSSISQRLILTNNARFDPTAPYHLVLAYNRTFGSGNGILRVRLGRVEVSVDLSGAAAGWNQVELGLGIDAWPDNFREDDLTLTISHEAGTAATYVNIDALRFAAYRSFDGGWYMPVTGAVPFEREDLFRWQDTENVNVGFINRHLWRLFRRHLPATVGDEAVTIVGTAQNQVIIQDPSLVLATLAANLGVEAP